MASFVPTFTNSEKTESTQTTAGELDEEDIPEELESKYNYIFLIDRSGSMSWNNRMKITNDALVLFLRSLPGGCKFGMLGFGSKFEWSKPGQINDYNNESKNTAIQ